MMTLELLRTHEAGNATPLVHEEPEQGGFYRIRKNDNLTKITSGAYKVGQGSRRLELAKQINNHPFNRRYWRKPKSDFNKRHFPDGFISFFPRFSCDDETLLKENQPPSKGHCYAIIFIPRLSTPLLDINGDAELRSFLPSAKKHHPTIGLTVTAKDLAAGDRIRWSPQTEADAKRFTLTGADRQKVNVRAETPGLATIQVSAINSVGEQVASTTARLSVPQFVVVRADSDAYRRALGRYLQAPEIVRDDLEREARNVADELLESVNVRVIWEVSDDDERVPPWLSRQKKVVEITFRDSRFNREGNPTYANFEGGDVGEDVVNERIGVFPGSFCFGMGRLRNLLLHRKNVKDSTDLDRWIAIVVGRLLGFVVAKVVLHSIGLPLGERRAGEPRTADIAVENLNLLRLEDMTGVRIRDMERFPSRSAIQDLGIGRIVRVSPSAQRALDRFLPVADALD